MNLSKVIVAKVGATTAMSRLRGKLSTFPLISLREVSMARSIRVAIVVSTWLLGCSHGTNVSKIQRNVPARTLDHTFADFEVVLKTNIVRKFPKHVANTCDRGFVAYYEIRGVAETAPQRLIPLRYVHSLQYDLNTFTHVVQLASLSPAQEAVLSYAVLNLELKASQAEKNPSRWADLIDTTVETVRNSKPVPNLQVWYCPRGWATLMPRWQRFAALSTPTTERLAPGMYMVAAQSPNINSVPMRVGGDGRLTAHFVLEVP
jgi:hypothetical protein